MGTTGHAFMHAGHRFQYVLALGDRSFSADVTCDGKALHHFSSPFNGYGADQAAVLEVCKRLVEEAIRENMIRWH